MRIVLANVLQIWSFNGWKIIRKYFDLWHFVQNVNWFETIAIRLDKVDGFIKVYDGNRYLLLVELDFRSIIRVKWYHICFFSILCKDIYWFIWCFPSRWNAEIL